MPTIFHSTLALLFQCMAKEGYTPEPWMNSQTVLIHKKADPTILDNYRPIALAPVIYKLLTNIITDIASNFAEKHKILSPPRRDFENDAPPPGPHSCYN